MAIRSQSLNIALPQTRATASARLAALPNGTIVAVFDSRVDAVGTAVQLAVENPDGSVWIATGAQASPPSSAVPFRGSPGRQGQGRALPLRPLLAPS